MEKKFLGTAYSFFCAANPRRVGGYANFFLTHMTKNFTKQSRFKAKIVHVDLLTLSLHQCEDYISRFELLCLLLSRYLLLLGLPTMGSRGLLLALAGGWFLFAGFLLLLLLPLALASEATAGFLPFLVAAFFWFSAPKSVLTQNNMDVWASL